MCSIACNQTTNMYYYAMLYLTGFQTKHPKTTVVHHWHELHSVHLLLTGTMESPTQSEKGGSDWSEITWEGSRSMRSTTQSSRNWCSSHCTFHSRTADERIFNLTYSTFKDVHFVSHDEISLWCKLFYLWGKSMASLAICTQTLKETYYTTRCECD